MSEFCGRDHCFSGILLARLKIIMVLKMKISIFIFSVVAMLAVSGCSDSDYGIGEIKCTCGSPKDITPPSSDDHYLLTCIYNGDLNTVKSVVDNYDLDEDDVPSAVIYAVKCGNPEILAWLLDNGWSANPEAYDSALASAYNVNCKTVKVLLDNDAELNENNEEIHWIGDDYKRSALHYAIGTRKLCMVKTTLECGVDADPGSSYYPPLLEAVYGIHSDVSGTDKICRLLVKYGADADDDGDVFIWQKKKSINPAEYLLHYRKQGTVSLLSFLMSHGADAKITPQDLEQMVTIEDVMNEDNELLEDYPQVRVNTLRSYLAIICETPDLEPGTPKELKKTEEMFQMMKDAGIDFDHPLPGRQETPLLIAARNRQYEICKLLIKYGASPNKEINGVSPLQYLK